MKVKFYLCTVCVYVLHVYMYVNVYVCMYVCMYVSVCMYVWYFISVLPPTPRPSPRGSPGMKENQEFTYIHSATKSVLPDENDGNNELSTTLESSPLGDNYSTYIHTEIQKYIHTYRNVHLCISIRIIHSFTYTYMHIYICIHSVHTYIHTYTLQT